jgi:fatty-acid desaturase
MLVLGRWDLILYALGWWFAGAMAITIYAHRTLSHNSLEIKWKWLEHAFCSLCILSNVGSPLAWAIVHRMHHVYMDEEKDPHSPHQIGFLNSLTHRWDVPFDEIPLRFTRGLLRQETPRWYHENGMFPFMFLTVFIWAVTVAYGTTIYGFEELGYYLMNIFTYDGPAVYLQTFSLEFAWAGFAGVALGQWSMGITNAWQHSDKRGKGYIRDIPWYLSFINWGEGSHKAHHNNPKNYSFGKGLNDPAQYIILFLAKIGAIKVINNRSI